MKQIPANDDSKTVIQSPPVAKYNAQAVNQSQPLQARSSNSGTSFKKSENSHSSYLGGGETCSEQPFNWHFAAANSQKPEHGQTTSAFSQNFQQLSSSQRSIGHRGGNSPKKPQPKSQGTSNSVTLSGRTLTSNSSRTRGTAGYTEKHAASSNVSTKDSQSAHQSKPNDSSATDSKTTPGQPIIAGVNKQRPGTQVSTRAVGQALSKSSQFQRPEKDEPLQTGARKLSDVTEGLKTQRQVKSEAGPPMRQTRSKSKSITVNVIEEKAVSTKREDDTEVNEKQKQEKWCPQDHSSNGQSALQTFNNLEEAEVGKDEINEGVQLDLAPCEGNEDSKMNRLDEGSSKRISPASKQSGVGRRVTDKQNLSFNISESADSLAENPLCTLIKQFQTRRINAQLTGNAKPTIQQFLDQFEKEMCYLEESYQTQMAMRKEQMRFLEQNFGMAKTTRATQPSNQMNNLPTTVLPKTPRMLPISSVPMENAEIADNFGLENSIQMSMGQQDGTHNLMAGIPEEGSMVSHQSYFNQNLSSQLGAPYSEMSVSEVYESYQFMQNSLISFYPKDVRRCIQRRKTLNSSQLSTDKMLNNLRAPKYTNKARKVAQKMQSLALCQVNMMQVLLQKISRKSKVIRKQEKIVNENLKRKRIFLEKERFDIMSVLRQTAQASEKSAPNTQKRQGSPQTNRCLSTVGTQSAIGLNVSLMNGKGISDDISVDEQLRKSGRLFSAQENTLSTTFAGEQASQKTSGLPQSNSKINQKKQDQLIKTPEKSQKKANLTESQYLQAEQKVQQALNLSEIEDSFVKASKNYSQRRDDSFFSASQETYAQGRLYGMANTANQDNGLQNTEFVMNMMTPEGVRAQNGSRLQSECYDRQQVMLTTNGITQGLIREDELQLYRKNQSTQAKRTKRPTLGEKEDITQPVQLQFNDQLTEEKGNFAIVDLEKTRQDNSIIGQDECSFKVKITDLPETSQQSKVTKKIKGSKSIAKAPKVERQTSDLKTKQTKKAKGSQSVTNAAQEEVEQEQIGAMGYDEQKMSPIGNGQQISQERQGLVEPHQLGYSQSLHMPQLDADQGFYEMQQMGDMGIVPQMMMINQQQPMYDMHIARSRSMMVPQQSYIGQNCIDDMFFDESPADMSSMDQNTQSNQNMGSYVANPYEAAKRSYFAQQKNQEGTQARNTTGSAERIQLIKQQASDQSNFTARQSNSHSHPQAQDARPSTVEQPAHNHQFISPMQLGPLSQAATPTPLNKIQENMPMVEGATTPSRFMSGVEQAHLCMPYMTNQQMYPTHLLMSAGYREDAHSQVQQLPIAPHGVDNSAHSGVSAFLRGNNYTPAAMLAGSNVAETHRDGMNVNAWHLDDNDTQTVQMVDTIVGNSAKTISEEPLRHGSSSQQRSAEAEAELFKPGYQQQAQYM